jgi:hypothetical protein
LLWLLRRGCGNVVRDKRPMKCNVCVCVCAGLRFMCRRHADPVFTPFYANGSVNLDAVLPYARYTAAAGTDTIILGGSTGEWPSMTSEERVDVLRAWRTAVDALQPGDLPLGRR